MTRFELECRACSPRLDFRPSRGQTSEIARVLKWGRGNYERGKAFMTVGKHRGRRRRLLKIIIFALMVMTIGSYTIGVWGNPGLAAGQPQSEAEKLSNELSA